jgi:K+-sensing histidine kinase KdpD
VGIEAERSPNIFNAYDHNAKLEEFGTGLDIPIIRALAHMLGGDIEAQSEKGKGTTARITIPCEATMVEKKKKEEEQ